MKVMVDPNQFKIIEVPISVMGEATGTVYNGPRGQGRILVNFYRSDSTLAARTLSESDGYYSYLGLKPGKYIARIDPDQLKKLRMVSSPEKTEINIPHTLEGVIVDGLDFKLAIIREQAPDTTNTIPKPKPIATPAAPAPTVMSRQTLTENKSVKIQSGLAIQLGAFSKKDYAVIAGQKLTADPNHPINIVFEDGFYKVQISGFNDRKQALAYLPRLRAQGFPGAYIVPSAKP
jgi:hypothetical protein